jgi:hypothetical protein
MGNSHEILELIDKININKAYEVFVPSKNKTVSIKPLITQQLKSLIESTDRHQYFNIGFHNTLTSIIINNVVDSSLTKDDLTELDKALIAYNIRVNDISNTLNDEELPNITELAEVIPPPLEINTFDFIIKCNIPSLTQEEECNQAITKLIEDNESADSKTIVSQVFIYEVAKYVTSLTVQGQVANWANFNEKSLLISKLPLNVVTKIIDYIDNVKKIYSTIFTTPAGKTIPYDISLFLS